MHRFRHGSETFQPDRLWSYHARENASLLDRRLTLNATAFPVDWSNVQTRKVDTSCSYFYIVSGEKVKSRGVELESTSKLTSDLSLALNASYTDATANGALPNIRALDGEVYSIDPKSYTI